MTFWHSLTGRLFKLVFGWYLVLAIGVTAVQLVIEFVAISDDIQRELKFVGQSFEPGLSDALWSFDRAQLDTLARGIVESAVVTGVRIESDRGQTMASTGTIPAEQALPSEGLLAPYQLQVFALNIRTPRGEQKAVGKLFLYSERGIALERIRASFIVILINSLIKTVGLWLIFHLVITRSLANPLARLTAVVSRVEFAAESAEPIPEDYPHADELGRLLAAMRRMQGRVLAARQEVLEVNRHLEETVARRTQALREEEEKLRGLFELSPVGIALTDMEGHYIEFNAAFCNICGYSAEVLKTLDYWALTPERYASAEARQLESLRQTGRYGPYEKEYRRRDGSLVPLRLNGMLVTGADGREYIWSIVEDITERKSVEAQLRLAATAYANSREGIVITSPENVIIDVNPGFAGITGYSRAEAIGRNPSFLSSGRHGPEFYAGMWDALRGNDFWRGEVWNRRKDGEVYAQMLSISAVRGDAGELLYYIGMFSDISHLKEHEAELSRIAYYDVLTGVPNRRLFSDRLLQALARAQRNRVALAVCYLDLDGFKGVNDRHGHQAGDQLLIQITERVRGLLRLNDTFARLGGDEFALLLTDLSQIDEYRAVLDRILAAVSVPMTIGGEPVAVSVSIGVTLSPPDTADAEMLLRHADEAMYLAKMAGKNRYRLYPVAA